MIDPNDPGTLDLVAACEEPLSGAERARRHRLKKKQEGVKAINLTSTDRMVLSLGLLAHEDLDHRPKDWATSKKPGFDALLKKLWPEGDNGRYLAEPARSTRRPTAFLRDELERQKGMVQRLEEINRDLRGENHRLQETLQQIAQEVGGGTVAAPVPDKVEARLRAQITSLQEQNTLEVADRGKAFEAVAVLQARLKKAGLVFDYRKQPGE